MNSRLSASTRSACKQALSRMKFVTLRPVVSAPVRMSFFLTVCGANKIVVIGNLCQPCYSELEIYIHGEGLGHAYTKRQFDRRA